MVASIAPMSHGIESYYTELAREDYYLNGGEPPGRWIGNAATSIGLIGEIEKEGLGQLLAGFGPGGEKLVRNAGSENRQVGWDITFSAPKDVSVVWGIGSAEQRTAIEDCHNKAVQTAIEFLQTNALWSRTGKGGCNWQKAEAVVATFLHGTSREVDPNLHTHALFANVGVREDGTTGTIVSKKLYEHKMVAGLIYRAALAEQLNQELGMELEQVKSWFQIKGFSKEAREHFSKRRNEIEKAAGTGASQKELDKATLTTRKVKGHVARKELFPAWKKQAEEFGLNQKFVDDLFENNQSKNRVRQKLEKACDQSAEELADSKGYFSKSDFLKSALSKLQTGEATVEEILKQCEETLGKDELKSLGKDQNQNDFFTLQDQLKLEEEMVDSATQMIKQIGKPIERTDVRKVIEGSKLHKLSKSVEAFIHEKLPEHLRLKFTAKDYTNLNGLQKAALYQITSEMGALKAISGRAGTGKTTMLAAAREVWESKGLHVVGCSVSGRAAQELAQGAGINSETVAMRLLQLEKSAWKTVKQEVRQVLRAFIGKNRESFEQFKLTKKSVLVIDEASMLDTKQLKQILDHAKKAKAKVVLVGDIRQLPSITAGGGFARLFKETSGIELTEVIRQKTKWLKEAVNLFAEYDTRGAFTKFAEADRLNFGKDNEEVRQNLIKDWDKNRTTNLAETIILAPTNKDVDALNLAAQDIRRRKGELEKSSFVWGKTKYFTGDRIAFHANNRSLGVWNGDRGTIKAIFNPLNSLSVRFTVELDSGRTITFCPRDLATKNVRGEEAISLGYATTVHKSQGMTVDKSFLMLDEKRTSQELAYVGLTRSRHDASVHCQTNHVEQDVVQYQKAKQELEQKTQQSQAKQLAEEAQKKLQEQKRLEAERQRRNQLSQTQNL